MASTRILREEQKPFYSVLYAAKDLIYQNEGICFGLVVFLTLVVRAIVLSFGFVSVSADEYARTLYGANWAKAPYVFEDHTVWQPWHFYLLGLALKVHYDLYLTPRVLTMAFSLASLGVLYLLVRKLFNRWVAILSAFIVGLLPVHVYLSLTPMVEIIFVTFTMGFLYLFFVWLDGRDDRHLLLAAVTLGLASGLRYDGWFTVAVFSVYLGLRWLAGLWRARSLRPLWMLAIVLACLPAFMWLLRGYTYWGDPLHFLKGLEGSGHPPRGIGRLTDLVPWLPLVDVLLQNGALICLLAMMGVVLSHRFLRHKLWLYLMFSFIPLAVLVVRGGIGLAYRPHYPFPYLVLLTPLCAYAIYWAVAGSCRSFHDHWQTSGRGVLALVSLYNLWLVYLGFSGRDSGVLICLLVLAGIVLSHRLLDHKHWLWWTLSLSPLVILMLTSRVGLISDKLSLYTGLYFVSLALFYAYNTWRASAALKLPSARQWRMAGLGMLVAICVYNLWGIVFRAPSGMPAGVHEAGLLVRQLFEEGALTKDDKVLFETTGWRHLGMQVMSNHPGNFILDRKTHSDEGSFLLGESSSPYEIGACFTDYEKQVNPLALDPPLSLDEYLKDRQVRLVVLRDPGLEALLTQQTEFERIDHVEDYFFYYAAPE